MEAALPLRRRGSCDTRPGLLLICAAAQYLPWALVPRGTYIYHYFPAVPFVILCLALVLERLEGWYAGRGAGKGLKGAPDARKCEKAASRFLAFLALYAALVIALFVAYYPFASGFMVSLRWLKGVNWFGNLYF